MRFRLLLPIVLLAVAAAVVSYADSYKDDLIAKVGMYEVSEGRFAPLYPAFAQQMVQDYGITKGVCVDVGCSVGKFAMEIAKVTEMTAYALDIDADAIRLASVLVDEAGLRGRVIPIEGDAQKMPFASEFADLVFSRGSIPFWPDREAGIRECYRILKPGGVAYVGGGFTSILPPEIREPLAKSMENAEDREGFKVPDDLDQVALRAGIPSDQFRFIKEPIAGWWLEIRKPANHTYFYREWSRQMWPWHKEMASQFKDRYNLRSGRCLELGWGAGSLSIPLAAITNLDFTVAGLDADAALVANERARDLGYADRVQAIACDPHHLPFKDRQFDYIIGHAGPAAWEEPSEVFAEIARVLRPRGVALVGNGCPLVCPADSEAAFRKIAKTLREAPFAPPHTFKRCAPGETFVDWIKRSGVKATNLSTGEIHNQWIEIRR